MLVEVFFNDTPVKIEQPIFDLTGAWPRLFEQFERSCRSATRAEEEHWRFLGSRARIIASEKTPPSPQRQIAGWNGFEVFEPPDLTRNYALLLKLPITPNAWTM